MGVVPLAFSAITRRPIATREWAHTSRMVSLPQNGRQVLSHSRRRGALAELREAVLGVRVTGARGVCAA
jgi:hypothetical protein